MSTLLVIGYGNELRSDDGAGPKVAAAVTAWNSPYVRALACHQLTPELAEPIASANAVVFVDATAERVASVQLRPIEAIDAADVMTHTTDPRALLSLAATVFGHRPQAWTLTIPVENIEFGDEISDLAAKGIQAALQHIRHLSLLYRLG